MRHQLFFRIDGGHGTRRGIGINRGGGDFSARDRSVANLLSPHFSQAYANAMRCERSLQIAITVENPAPNTSELLMCLRADDRIETLSEPARQWIFRHLGIDLGEGSVPPDAWLQWLRRADANGNEP